MKLNLLISERESLQKGPGRRAANLMKGLERIGVPYEVASRNYDYAVGLQFGLVFNLWEELPAYTPIGPNVMHCAADNTNVAGKFRNYVVQGEWVADYWKWQNPEETMFFRFFVYPPAADLEDGYRDIAKNRKPTINCVHYAKYQNGDNLDMAKLIWQSRNHSCKMIEYGSYTIDELKAACASAEYLIYNSCCEKSSNALMEIMACGIPVYVIDGKKWIGDDRFDRATSAPHFSEELCGVKGDMQGTGFDAFYDNVKAGKYNPHQFVADGYTIEKTAKIVVDIVDECHP